MERRALRKLLQSCYGNGHSAVTRLFVKLALQTGRRANFTVPYKMTINHGVRVAHGLIHFWTTP